MSPNESEIRGRPARGRELVDPAFFSTLFVYNDWADGQVMDLAARLSAVTSG